MWRRWLFVVAGVVFYALCVVVGGGDVVVGGC